MIQIIAIMCYWSVDIFAILTGYLYFDKKVIKSNRIISLLVTVLFYSAIITFIVYLLSPSLLQNNIKEVIESLFPPIAGFYWYITCYTFVFFMIPYINRFLKTLTEREYLVFVALLTILLSTVPTLGIADYFRTSKGYSPWWLLYCYVIGAYIKKANIVEKYRKKTFISVALGNVLLCFLLWNFLILVTRKFGIDVDLARWFSEYISPFTVTSAACMVCIFSGIVVNHSVEKLIKSLSAAAFGVYILHCHRLIFIYFLKDAFKWIAKCNFILEIIAFIFVVCTIYFICWIIECARNKLFCLLRAEKAISWLGNRIDKVLMWK